MDQLPQSNTSITTRIIINHIMPITKIINSSILCNIEKHLSNRPRMTPLLRMARTQIKESLNQPQHQRHQNFQNANTYYLRMALNVLLNNQRVSQARMPQSLQNALLERQARSHKGTLGDTPLTQKLAKRSGRDTLHDYEDVRRVKSPSNI